jgi:hypothetical protein
MVLRDIDAGLAEAVKAAASPPLVKGGDTGEAGDAGFAGEAGALDLETAAVADEAGEPPALVIPDRLIVEGVERLQREGVLTPRKLAELARLVAWREKQHGHHHGHRLGFLRGLRHAHRYGHEGHRDVWWNRSRELRGYRTDILRRYSRLHGGAVAEGIGYYYGTVQVVFDASGTPSDAVFSLDVPNTDSPIIDQAFDYAIGDTDPDWYPNAKKLTPTQTNLQNPGTNLYPDELFFIEAVQARFQGVQISYASNIAEFNPQPAVGSALYKVLTGESLLWDRAARILPAELFNQYNDTCELAQAVAEATTVWFTWADRQLGANKVTTNKLIGRFSAIPGSSRTGLREVSGAGLSLDLPRGFIWCLDKQFQASVDEGGNGLFDVEIHVDDSVVFPFQPISLFGSAAPIVPDSIALSWQFVLWGTSLVPARSEHYVVRRRQ